MLHWVDLSILAIILLSVITGLARGFVKELLALCIWALAIWLAYNHSQSLDPLLQKYLQDPMVRAIAGFVLVLISTLVLGGIINAILGFIMKRSGLSGTDRILGMGFGFIRGVFLVAVIMVVIKMTSLPHELYAKESRLYAQFDPLVAWIHDLMPDLIKKVQVLDQEFESKTASLGKPDKLTDLSNQLDVSDA